MTLAHNLGFPRIGARRELKFALERYWRGEISQDQLQQQAQALRRRHWQQQAEAGLDLIPVNDFSLYDHMLDHTALLGCVPARFGPTEGPVDLDTYFRMARGRAPTGAPAAACEMTKWFDTNYHYLVPELHPDLHFRLSTTKLFDETAEALALGYRVKPVLPGPLTWLWLGKARPRAFDKLQLLERLLPIYGEILHRLAELGVEWVQLDEPILVLDLPPAWRQAFEQTYNRLRAVPIKLLLTTYFGALADNRNCALSLPVDGLHLDAVRAPEELIPFVDGLSPYQVLSVGIVDGRNIWKTDLRRALDLLQPVRARLGDRLWVSAACSLLHVPVDLAQETELDGEIKHWLAFARQKVQEIALLKQGLVEGPASIAEALRESDRCQQSRRTSGRIHQPAVQQRMARIAPEMKQRQRPYAQRNPIQRQRLQLPLLPTTTIGSFPQTPEIRKTRSDFRQGRISEAQYIERMRAEIRFIVDKQEALELDVLVHGEPERNDMVEYFGELLDGFAFTRFGWVQSYGSRCVKPPILYGDVARPKTMTVDWIRFAQSCTQKPMKGMLTGPVTLLNWSFVRDDQPRSATCAQIALALREEVLELERAGIPIIQIDEAALREGLPLRRRDQGAYLDWAIDAFRLTASGVRDETQIHTHMCYSEFNDILPAIARMDADVITLETSRSGGELLEVFKAFAYPNEIGPGVYDIHSPNVPTVEEIVQLMRKAAEHIPVERLWINPDCGLKTRDWPEVEAALKNMVAAAKRLRREYATDRACSAEPAVAEHRTAQP